MKELNERCAYRQHDVTHETFRRGRDQSVYLVLSGRQQQHNGTQHNQALTAQVTHRMKEDGITRPPSGLGRLLVANFILTNCCETKLVSVSRTSVTVALWALAVTPSGSLTLMLVEEQRESELFRTKTSIGQTNHS